MHIQLSYTLLIWGRDKMAAIFQLTFSNAFSWMKMYEFRFKISLRFVSEVPISSNPALFQILVVLLHSPWPLHTRPDSLNIVCVRPFPVDTNCSYYGQSYWPIPAQINFHCATTLSCHYIQYSALEPCSCPGCCIYTYMAPNTPTILPYSTFFKPTFMWFMVGAGVIGRPFLSFLDGTPHKQAW